RPFPYTTLFRSRQAGTLRGVQGLAQARGRALEGEALVGHRVRCLLVRDPLARGSAGRVRGAGGGARRLPAHLRRDRKIDDPGRHVQGAEAAMSALDGHPVLAPDVFDGFTLLAADAGTGKAGTLANLVLRALIERNARIDEIVVVTFTRKAAAELRDRIMRAIESLEAALAGAPATDPFIAAYLPRCEPGRDLHRLRRARALFEE